MQATGATPSTHIVSPAISENPAPVPRTPMLPPIHGPLPVAREDYEKWNERKKSPELDFLILGKIPDGDRQVRISASAQDRFLTIPFEEVFSEVVSECICLGEMDALEFLWRESGRNPDTSTVNVNLPNVNAAMMKALTEHCDAHPGLMVDLVTCEFDRSIILSLAGLLTQGKIGSLNTIPRCLAPADLQQLVECFGKLKELNLSHTKFDIHSEKVFAETLLNSTSLKKLTILACDFGASGGMQFVEGMQKNRSIIDLVMQSTPITTTASSGYGAMLAKNTVLQSVTLEANSRRPLDIDSIIIGATSHPSLRSLDAKQWGQEVISVHPSNLYRLLRNNSVLTKLNLDMNLLGFTQYKRLAASLKTNMSITEFSLRDWEEIPAGARKSMEDTLARNRALANRSTLVKAGQAFDPDPLLRNGLSDAGSVIARYVLANSSSLEEFAHTMAGVELSMREAINQTLANSSSSATTTTTTTTGTTTTTTTTTTPPGSASS